MLGAVDARILGRCAAIGRVREELACLAAEPLRSVLVIGETGTGKDLVPRVLAARSRHLRDEVEVFNCPAVPSDHLESELFGTRRGAYPGALDRPGAAERARGGVLFLDEIGAMSLAHQGKVLRLLESGEARRLGATRPYHSDATVVAATNEDPLALIERGALRSDLYYRLVQDAVIELPPLRERPGDLPILATAFLREVSPGAEMTCDALAALDAYAWPGNVRELRAVVRGAARLARDRAVRRDAIGEALRRVARTTLRPPQIGVGVPPTPGAPPRFDAAVVAVRRQLLVETLQVAGGNRTRAGILLGFHCAGAGAAGAVDLRARKRAHRRFSYWWDRLVEPGPDDRPREAAVCTTWAADQNR